MDGLISDLREYLKGVNEGTSWFCIVDDVNSILDSYEGKPPPALPEFVTVMSRTGTSARWWCDDCDWGGGWVSPREAFDGAYEHVNSRHPKTT